MGERWERDGREMGERWAINGGEMGNKWERHLVSHVLLLMSNHVFFRL